jgi:hypothetical protein
MVIQTSRKLVTLNSIYQCKVTKLDHHKSIMINGENGGNLVIFGYKGNNQILQRWKQRMIGNLPCYQPTLDQNLLWKTHQLYLKHKALNRGKLLQLIKAELGDNSWLFPIIKAFRLMRQRQSIKIIYLSQKYDQATAAMYYNYCNWLLNND